MAIAEACMAGSVGATVDPWPEGDELVWLFSECPGGGFVVSGSQEAFERLAERTPLTVFGTVGGHTLCAADPSVFEVSLNELRAASVSLAAVFP